MPRKRLQKMPLAPMPEPQEVLLLFGGDTADEVAVDGDKLPNLGNLIAVGVPGAHHDMLRESAGDYLALAVYRAAITSFDPMPEASQTPDPDDD